MDYNLAFASYLLKDPKSLLLDIRTPEEYTKGHLANAILIPTPLPPLTDKEENILYSQLYRIFYSKPYNTPVIIYCKKGIRAELARNMLSSMGFFNTTVLGGVKVKPLSDLFNN
jgi:rhodanese-related sulfurtransferase